MIFSVHEKISLPKETFDLLFQYIKVVHKCIEKKKCLSDIYIYLYKYKCKNKFYSPSVYIITFFSFGKLFDSPLLYILTCASRSDKEYARCVTRTCLVREFYKILPSPLFDGIRK